MVRYFNPKLDLLVLSLPENADMPEWLEVPDDFQRSDYYTPKLKDVQRIKIKEIERTWERKLTEGYDTSVGIKVKCQPIDITMLQIGLEKASKTGTLDLFRDYNNKLHRDLPYETIKTIYDETIQYLDELWTRKVLLQEKIENMDNTEEIMNITWDSPLD